MKFFEWDTRKNEWLIKNRGISFEMCITCIEQGHLLADTYNEPARPLQRVFIINIEGYAYKVPYVEDEEKIFLKTAFPSRDATRQYLR